MTTGYVVTIEVRPEQPGDPDTTAEQIDTFTGWLAQHHGIVAGDHRGWTATVTVDVEEPDTWQAARQAWQVVRSAAREAGLPVREVIRVEAVREDIRDAELERPALPPLVGSAEAADMLGVSRQRLHQLITRGDFPRPAVTRTFGTLYYRHEVERYAAQRRRRSRPPRAA